MLQIPSILLWAMRVGASANALPLEQLAPTVTSKSYLKMADSGGLVVFIIDP